MTAVPLAWKNLIHSLPRLSLAVAGIAFAVVLMFQQRGFNNALLDSTVEVLKKLDADAFLLSPKKFTLSSEDRFDQSVLEVASSVPGIESVKPVYLEIARARFRAAGHKAIPIRVIAFDLSADLPFAMELTDEEKQTLRKPETILFDLKSHPDYQVDVAKLQKNLENSADGKVLEETSEYEISGKPVNISGLFSLGRDFAHDGNVLMSLENFKHYFPFRAADPGSIVDIGLVKFSSGSSHQESNLSSLREKLPPSVVVLGKQEYIDREVQFWSNNTPVGVIFGIGSVIGFVVGVFICYNVLASDISDHMSEFATMKAMGYTDRYFFGLVVKQSLYLSVMGFLPGLILSWVAFYFTSELTGLLMILTPMRCLVIFLVAVVMCVCSGLLALRKLLAADPASLF